MTASDSGNLVSRLARIEAFPGSAARDRQGSDGNGRGSENTPPSVATRLTDLMRRSISEVWHTPDREPFATFIGPNGVVSHVAINSSDSAEMAHQAYYHEFNSVITPDAVKAVVTTIAAGAKYAGSEHPVFSRIAHHAVAVWVDLGDQSGQAVRIDANGWSRVPSTHLPVRFRRSQASRPLPVPERGGSLEELRALFLLSDEDWRPLSG